MLTMKRSMRGIAEALSAASVANGETFPYVTMALFEVTGKNAREQSGVEYFLFAPLVENMTEWVTYAETNSKAWLQESFSVAKGAGYENETIGLLYPTTIDIPFTIMLSTDNGILVPVQESGPWAPVWQTSPPPFHPEQIMNLDLLSHPTYSRIIPAALDARGTLNGELLSIRVYPIVSCC